MLSEIVKKWGGRVEAPMDLYTDVFHLGEGYLQSDGEPSGKFKANPVILGKSGDRGDPVGEHEVPCDGKMVAGLVPGAFACVSGHNVSCDRGYVKQSSGPVQGS